MIKSQKKLGEVLVGKGLITSEQLKAALEEQARTKEFLGTILLKKNQIKERDLLVTLSEQFNISFISLKNKYIDWNLVKTFNPSLILEYKCFPVERDEQSVTIAITNPLDAWAIKKAEEGAKDLKLKLVLVSASDMQEAIQRYQRYMRGDIFNLFK